MEELVQLQKESYHFLENNTWLEWSNSWEEHREEVILVEQMRVYLPYLSMFLVLITSISITFILILYPAPERILWNKSMSCISIVKKNDFHYIENDFVCSKKCCNFVIYYVIRCNYVLRDWIMVRSF
jgi:hypothetical protein